ncbi:hypothetical protein EOT10_19795 [Streptomyces antnestii]|uniref:Acyl-CoA dehydrogenase/oxidase C-terminal domain-containing protein n=1 Tax=Streptomyces antnestii TaxID=2494256 RepID=A0A437PLU3_9ACTN|nr:acyl-CoA dehydrogenase family protein [Streptomyces sp. San01]RVU23250.1 hypothetical protein EOT10_19795 [Streptomyces sp. San01]
MSTTEEFDPALDEAVREVVTHLPRPRAGKDLTRTDAFRAQWNTAVELGWTGILDDADFTDPGSPESRELLDAACGAVTALARAGFALPLRQTLVARYATAEALPADAIAVHPTAYGVWEPAATALVAADGTVSMPVDGGTADEVDLAGRPYRLMYEMGEGGDEAGEALPRRVADVAELLLLQEILGAAEGAVAEARRYVTERVQFGSPLIKIPAVRTIAGELTVSLRQLDTAVHEARRRFRAGDEHSLHFALITAREVASAVSTEVTRAAHQLHGAMGITEEASLHWRTKLLWADRDEGVFSRDRGLDALPADEVELWTLTTPARAGT